MAEISQNGWDVKNQQWSPAHTQSSDLREHTRCHWYWTLIIFYKKNYIVNDLKKTHSWRRFYSRYTGVFEKQGCF